MPLDIKVIPSSYYIIPASTIVEKYVDSLDWSNPADIWEAHDNVSEHTRNGLIGALMDDLSNGDITFGDANHTLVTLNRFMAEFEVFGDIEAYDPGTMSQIRDIVVFVDMEN